MASASLREIWTDETSVLFMSLWEWIPEEWGMVPWTDKNGREEKIKELSDPFICVCYVTSTGRSDQKEKICGFYLASHEKGDRDEFSHPNRHNEEPEKWRFALRAERAFDYLPEYRPIAKEVFPEISKGQTAQGIGRWGKIIKDPKKIRRLQKYPYYEVDVFSSPASRPSSSASDTGMVKAGPASRGNYEVSGNIHDLPRELYVLRLDGETAAYLGRSDRGKSIYKIGLSVSPERRRNDFRKAMPRGAFKWEIYKTTRMDGHKPYGNHSAAVKGENAMEEYLAQNAEAEHLGGEFYLATKKQIEDAWSTGRKVARA